MATPRQFRTTYSLQQGDNSTEGNGIEYNRAMKEGRSIAKGRYIDALGIIEEKFNSKESGQYHIYIKTSELTEKLHVSQPIACSILIMLYDNGIITIDGMINKNKEEFADYIKKFRDAHTIRIDDSRTV